MSAYRQLLKSLGVDSRSRWTPLAAEVAAHPAGAVLSDEAREDLFREYVAELRVRGWGCSGAWVGLVGSEW